MDMQETARTQEGRVHVHVWWGVVYVWNSYRYNLLSFFYSGSIIFNYSMLFYMFIINVAS